MHHVGPVGRMRHAPEIIEVDNPRLDEVLGRVEQALTPGDAALIRAVFASYRYVTDLVEDKNTSLRRLRQLLFGGRTEKTAAIVGDQVAAHPEQWLPWNYRTTLTDQTGAAQT